MPYHSALETDIGTRRHEAFYSLTVPKLTSAVCPKCEKSRLETVRTSSKAQSAHQSRCHKLTTPAVLIRSYSTSNTRHLLRVFALAYVDSEPQQQTTASGNYDLEAKTAYEASDFASASQEGFCVVNFYHLTALDQPHAVEARHRRWLQDRDVQGRIYISSQGINAQLSGPETDAHAYARWVSEQEEFQVCLRR